MIPKVVALTAPGYAAVRMWSVTARHTHDVAEGNVHELCGPVPRSNSFFVNTRSGSEAAWSGVVLLGRQVDPDSAHGDLSRPRVDRELAVADDLAVATARDTAEHRADPGEQLGIVERLGDTGRVRHHKPRTPGVWDDTAVEQGSQA
jgi:hypothetical protein